MKIGTKIGIVFSLLLTVIVSFAFFYFSVAYQHVDYLQSHQEEMEELNYIVSLQTGLHELAMPANDYLIAGSEDNEFRNFESARLKVDDLFQKLDMHDIDMIEERELLEHVRDDYQQMKDLAVRIFSIRNPVGNEEAGRLMEELDRR